MRAAIISVTKNGENLGAKIAEKLPENIVSKRFCFKKNSDEIPHNNAEFYDNLSELAKSVFGKFDALVFVCACGIAVREIAPLVRSKATDPAVVVVDEGAKFAVPVLSGHLGGANRLAEIIAEKIGTVPVITTATDVSGKFSPDSFARANRLVINDLKAAKEVAAAVVRGEKIGLSSEFPCGEIPPEFDLKNNVKIGISISENGIAKPFETTLSLMPKNIIAGIGCRKNVSVSEIENAVFGRLEELEIPKERLAFAASAEIKRAEPALPEFAEKYKIGLRFFSAEELMSVSGNFTSSEFVKKITGADNVCERAAACCGGEIIAAKKACGRITTAFARLPVELCFERKIEL